MQLIWPDPFNAMCARLYGLSPNRDGEPMPASEHRLFPIVLHCVHCDVHLALWDHQSHVEIMHPDCQSCQIEIVLSNAFMTDMREAIAAAFGELESAPGRGPLARRVHAPSSRRSDDHAS